MSLEPPMNVCPVIGKARLLVPRLKHKPHSHSQQSLFKLLEKRKERYLVRRDTRQFESDMKWRSDPVTSSTCVVLPQLVHNSLNTELASIHSSNSSLFSPVNGSGHRQLVPGNGGGDAAAKGQTVGCCQFTSQPSCNLLNHLECSELAEHVVNRAKVRLRRRLKTKANSTTRTDAFQQELSFSGSVYQSHLPKLHTPSHVPNTQLPKNSAITLAAQKYNSLVRRSHSANCNSDLIDVSSMQLVGQPTKETMSAKVISWSRVKPASKVIYLSEKHSLTPKETGVPNVPPVTPNEAYSQQCKFVASLADLKSQRQLKSRLHEIISKLKEKTDETYLAAKEEKKRKEAVTKLKARQRAEIYALNKLMAQLEEDKFQAFMSAKV